MYKLPIIASLLIAFAVVIGVTFLLINPEYNSVGNIIELPAQPIADIPPSSIAPEAPSDTNHFIPVARINSVPKEAIAGIPLILSGTVFPQDATNQAITWLVKDAGSTDAMVVNNTLFTMSMGKVVLTVKIDYTHNNGKETADTVNGELSFTQDFSISVLDNKEAEPFIPVTDIIYVPDVIMRGATMYLSDIVVPPDATKQDINWNIKDEGTTGATIADGELSTKTTGKLIITATIPEGLSSPDIVSIAAGEKCLLALKEDGSLWMWEKHIFCLLSKNTIPRRDFPIHVGTSDDWGKISAGKEHYLAIKTDGSLWTWGDNNYGQLGNSTNINSANIPICISSTSYWETVAAGENYSIAIKQDGSMWAWGCNSYGQLGDGTNTNRNTPVRIGEENDWKMVAAGSQHSVALKADGSLWAWGSNNYGQLGNNDDIDCVFPVRIGSDTDWASVSVGGYHTIAIKNDGSLWAWGNNNTGQLGDNTTINRSTPTNIHKRNEWATVSAGYDYSIAVTKDGNLWAWGANDNGQLGDGTYTTRYIPICIAKQNNWSAVLAGKGSTIVMRTDSSIWAWGKDIKYLYYDGTSIDCIAPVKIETPPGWDSYRNFIKDFAISVENNTITIVNSSLFAWRVAPQFGYDSIRECMCGRFIIDEDDEEYIYNWLTGRFEVMEHPAHGPFGIYHMFYDEKKELYSALYYECVYGKLTTYPKNEFLEKYDWVPYYVNEFRKIDFDKVIETQLDADIWDFDYDYSEALISNKYALAYGLTFLSDYIYDDFHHPEHVANISAVKLDGKWGVIDKNGNTAIPFIFDDIMLIDEEIAFVKHNGKYGILDIKETSTLGRRLLSASGR